MKRCELDLDDPPAPLAGKVEAGIDGEAIEPGIEPVGISKFPEIPPGSDQPLLDRVACELRVAEDEASGLVQPHDGGAGELGEGVMIASPCPLHEPSLVHGRLAIRTRPRRSCLIAYGDENRFSVLRRESALSADVPWRFTALDEDPVGDGRQPAVPTFACSCRA
jgi:hypothetical protein